MKLFKILFFSSIFFLLWGAETWAGNMKILFFYPGGQGSQEEAQPLLDSFSEGLAKASGGKIKPDIIYISDPGDGVSFIQKQKPVAGILSLDVFLKNGKSWGADVIAQSLQLPSADGKNQYFIVGASKELPPGNIAVYSSRPLGSGFVNGDLFPQIGQTIELKVTPNVVGKLRKIGKGEEKGWVLLDQFEYANISRLKSSWAQALHPVAESSKIPSAPFVVFRNRIQGDQAVQLQSALLQLSKDPKLRETLALLRLKGFKRP